MTPPGPPPWLTISRGQAPLIVSLPHTGVEIPEPFGAGLVSPWLARRDADWWVDRLYDFAAGLGATVVRTAISRTVIDVNRDPSGASLYPGQATTELCPTTTFDGETLYELGREPDAAAVARRRAAFFDPYHAALEEEIARLRARHEAIVLYDCHSIRSVIPRLFDGTLPNFNIGTDSGRSCDPRLTRAVAAVCAASAWSHVVDGRFRGGTITRHFGDPARGVHAIQMELACRTYMPEPDAPVAEGDWPAPYDPAYAAPVQARLHDILEACLAFVARPDASRPHA
ncbi:N-formylglutamate deformylase [Methylobacterium sp. J-030]|uniref:N-formylglutamate deformylase n=1 Tax=Methylobacterium sp. J-030 TaxID=2836627 RepID=UPI001FB8EBA3|nr:N-formylglutamate deformylase [Methylobacterium sp. J-030]MCJ2071352.1 N-formylglutamate deformylase [Methylobacterium sp. J-030]